MAARKPSPSPRSVPRPDDGRFIDDEAPTRPGPQEYRADMLVRAWRQLGERDKAWLERLLDLMAWAKR